ncbi:uncharacterized protein LOC135953305 [Calliphora vicina]|uniref:uncharacterized protein LOC135953305 n=1 Tax=Calliphora vicina TaxID=7373 RepID=UPI00325B54E9
MPVQNKNVFSSTINNGDNRLQRKSIHRILSFESAINQIGESELVVTDFDDTICNSTNINDRTPRRQRVENECSMKLRRNLMTVQNRNIFSSTVNNGYSPKAVPESNTNPAPLFDSNKENSTANNQRIRKRKFKIGNTLSAWSPFWDRNNTSSRLSRRHYVTDFLDSMEQ